MKKKMSNQPKNKRTNKQRRNEKKNSGDTLSAVEDKQNIKPSAVRSRRNESWKEQKREIFT